MARYYNPWKLRNTRIIENADEQRVFIHVVTSQSIYITNMANLMTRSDVYVY